jgi:hypothetical protein
MGAMPLNPNVLANLIAIRSLRDLAIGQARGSSAMQRQAAVILLDAAIERVAFTAAEYLGESFSDHDHVDKPLQALRAKGWQIGAGLETSRKRLRRMRNVVQHVGTGVDRDELPRWLIDTERVLASIVLFAYEVEIDDVRYSSAIKDEQTREYFDAAESFMHDGDLDAAMTSISRSYSVVAHEWERFAVASNSELGPRSARYVSGIGSVGGDDSKVAALQSVALLTAIVPEPSEALWFLEARRQSELLNLEEVQRALVFVFNFATAVEASPAARQEDRRQRRNLEQRHERLSSEAPAKIRSFRTERSLNRTTVTFVLEGVPQPADYDEWARAVTGVLNEPSPSTPRFWINDAGELVVYQPEEDFVDAITRIEEALASAESTIALRRAEAAAEIAEKRNAEEEFRAQVIAATPPDLPSWLHLGATAPSYGPKPYAVVVTISVFDGRSFHNTDLSKAFVDAGAAVALAREGWVCPSLDPAEIPEFVAKLIPLVEAIASNQNEEEKVLEEQLRPLVEELARRGYARDRT